MRLLIALSTALALLIGCGNETPAANPLPPPSTLAVPPQDDAAGPDNPEGKRAEAAFLSALQQAGVPITSQSTVVGHNACRELRTGASYGKVSIGVQIALGTNTQQSINFVGAVIVHLCPNLTPADP